MNETNKKDSMVSLVEEIPALDLNIDEFQVVRGEYFAHVREPSMTFKSNKISLNMACVKRLPEVEYIQILISPDKKKIIVRPSKEDEKDSFVWCTRGEKHKPKDVSCRVFFAKIIDAMGWNPHYRYKLLGKLIKSAEEHLFLFDLTATETFPCIVLDNDKTKMARAPLYPQEWQENFGQKFEEHKERLQANIFKNYVVFSVDERLNSSTIEEQKLQEE